MSTSISEKFDNDDEFLEFDRVKNKKSNRPDLHAFLLLDELFPNNKNIIVSASHDQIWLGISLDDIVSLADKQIVELCRCGVGYCDEAESLTLFV